jgi:hypothetical protein
MKSSMKRKTITKMSSKNTVMPTGSSTNTIITVILLPGIGDSIHSGVHRTGGIIIRGHAGIGDTGIRFMIPGSTGISDFIPDGTVLIMADITGTVIIIRFTVDTMIPTGATGEVIIPVHP